MEVHTRTNTHIHSCTIRDIYTLSLPDILEVSSPRRPRESDRRGSRGAVLKLGSKPFQHVTSRFSSSTLLGWKTLNSVFLPPPSLPPPFLSYPPSFRVCVSLFDGLVSALCFPFSLHSAVQRWLGPEAGHPEWERHQGGVRAQGETRFGLCSFLSEASWPLISAWLTRTHRPYSISINCVALIVQKGFHGIFFYSGDKLTPQPQTLVSFNKLPKSNQRAK